MKALQRSQGHVRECASMGDRGSFDAGARQIEYRLQAIICGMNRSSYECIPNVLLLSLWLAQQTKRLKFGCAFNVLPMWHPLRLVEDFAILTPSLCCHMMSADLLCKIV